MNKKANESSNKASALLVKNLKLPKDSVQAANKGIKRHSTSLGIRELQPKPGDTPRHTVRVAITKCEKINLWIKVHNQQSKKYLKEWEKNHSKVFF